MSRGVEAELECPGVFRGDPVHDPAQRLAAHLDQQVNVVAHPTERVHLGATCSYGAGDDGVEQRTLAIVPEDVLPMIAAKRGVVETAGNMDTKRSCHVEIMASIAQGQKALLHRERPVIEFGNPGLTPLFGGDQGLEAGVAAPTGTASEVLANFTNSSATAPASEPQPMTMLTVCSVNPCWNR